MTTVKAFNEDGSEEGRGTLIKEVEQHMVLIKPRNGDPFWWPKGLTQEFTTPKYSVENGFLFINGEQVPYYPTPNYSPCYPSKAPEFLIWHYSAGNTLESCIARFMIASERASSHLAFGLDGKVVQFAPFNRPTWHAGYSIWGGMSDINQHSIGFEIVNYGWLEKKNGLWIRNGVVYKESDILILPHRLSGQVLGWPIFPQFELDIVLEVSKFVYDFYGLIDAVGHEDVSTEGKPDPGPAFPMEYFREQVCGQTDDYLIGWGGGKGLKPWYNAPSLIGWSWTRSGVHVEILETKRRESRVRILEGNTKGKEGYIETRYLRRIG